MKKIFLIKVAADANNNKYYNMIQTSSDSFKVEFGRVEAKPQTKTYPMSKWDSTYRSKISKSKGYTDISHLKEATTIVADTSKNQDFHDFYKVFSKYTNDIIAKTYITNTATPQQIEEAQNILNEMTTFKQVKKVNTYLEKYFTVIPKKMKRVSDHLITDLSELNTLISNEQNALTSMQSSNIINTVDPLKELNVNFELVDCPPDLRTKLEKNINAYGHGKSIYKVYKVWNDDRQSKFDNYVKKSKNKKTELLFHGTQNGNVFSIMKTGLKIRPTNAVSYNGQIYGLGVYHSADSHKSLNYCGSYKDSIFFIQNVHIGNTYNYDGWYRDGKGLSRSEMNYSNLQKLGYDSVSVNAGDGLRNSEYIVYSNEQTVCNYIVWFK